MQPASAPTSRTSLLMDMVPLELIQVIWRLLDQQGRSSFKETSRAHRNMVYEFAQRVTVCLAEGRAPTQHLLHHPGRFPKLTGVAVAGWVKTSDLTTMLPQLSSHVVTSLALETWRRVDQQQPPFDLSSVPQLCPGLQAFAFDPTSTIDTEPLQQFGNPYYGNTFHPVDERIYTSHARALAALPSLTHLRVGGTLLQVDLAALFTLTRLTHLSLPCASREQLAAPGLAAAVSRLRCLRSLHLAGVTVESALLAALRQLPQLESLWLHRASRLCPLPTAGGAAGGAAGAAAGVPHLAGLTWLALGANPRPAHVLHTLQALLPLPSLTHVGMTPYPAISHLTVCVFNKACVEPLRRLGGLLTAQPLMPVSRLSVMWDHDRGVMDLGGYVEGLGCWSRLPQLDLWRWSLKEGMKWPGELCTCLRVLVLQWSRVTQQGLGGLLRALTALRRLVLCECEEVEGGVWDALASVRPFVLRTEVAGVALEKVIKQEAEQEEGDLLHIVSMWHVGPGQSNEW